VLEERDREAIAAEAAVAERESFGERLFHYAVLARPVSVDMRERGYYDQYPTDNLPTPPTLRHHIPRTPPLPPSRLPTIHIHIDIHPAPQRLRHQPPPERQQIRPKLPAGERQRMQIIQVQIPRDLGYDPAQRCAVGSALLTPSGGRDWRGSGGKLTDNWPVLLRNFPDSVSPQALLLVPGRC
jgi:hypothetical protein